MWDLVPWPGIKPETPALGGQSLSRWTTREVPGNYFFIQSIYNQGFLDYIPFPTLNSFFLSLPLYKRKLRNVSIHLFMNYKSTYSVIHWALVVSESLKLRNFFFCYCSLKWNLYRIQKFIGFFFSLFLFCLQTRLIYLNILNIQMNTMNCIQVNTMYFHSS